MQHATNLRSIVQTWHAASVRHILIFITLLGVTFATHAQTKRISLTAKNAPVKEVLREIEQKSNYRILYNDEVVPDDLRVTIEASDESVKTVLETILKGTDLTFVLQSDELIIITRRQYVSDRAEITASGLRTFTSGNTLSALSSITFPIILCSCPISRPKNCNRSLWNKTTHTDKSSD